MKVAVTSRTISWAGFQNDGDQLDNVEKINTLTLHVHQIPTPIPSQTQHYF